MHATDQPDDSDDARLAETVRQLLKEHDATALLVAATFAAVKEELPLCNAVCCIVDNYGIVDPELNIAPAMAELDKSEFRKAHAAAKYLAAEYMTGTLAVALLESARAADISPSRLIGLFTKSVAAATK